jgi:PEP-CTERM motif
MRGMLSATTLLLGLGLATTASALPFTMAPVGFTIGSTSGTITLVGGGQGLGPTGTTLSGTPGLADDLLIFQVSVTSGSLVEVGVGIFLNFSTGSGTIAGPDVNMVNGTVTATGPSLRTFSPSPSPLSATSDPIWVTWASVANGASVTFMLNDGTSQLPFTGVVSLVPEPGTLLLAGLGLAGLGFLGRARRSA